MTLAPQPAKYTPDPAFLELGEGFADPVEPADFPDHILRFRNDRWAEAVGLADLGEAAWVTHFGKFEPLPDNLQIPLALRYHGHQFRNYNPEIGDGRGFLFAQLHDGYGRLLDLGTKGSGQTPYSRFGDGRLTLKGGVREVLGTEMLEALGVDTSKSFSLIETGEALHRDDEPSPTRSSVLVRLSHGHIRIGSFQRLAAERDEARMKELLTYSLKHYFAEEAGGDAAERLLTRMVEGGATLAASYMTAGFVHGVLNSDNINITAESFDYGPWRFTPHWEPGFTAAYFDHAGLYCFARQAEAIHWDIAQLAVSLRLIEEAEPLIAIIERFPQLYQDAFRMKMLWRLGVEPRGEEEDLALLRTIEEALREKTVTIDRFFFDWRGGERRSPSPADDAYRDEKFAAAERMLEDYGGTVRDHPYWSGDAPCSMHIDELEAIWSRIDEADDWEPFHDKIAAIRRMGEALRA